LWLLGNFGGGFFAKVARIAHRKTEERCFESTVTNQPSSHLDPRINLDMAEELPKPYPYYLDPPSANAGINVSKTRKNF